MATFMKLVARDSYDESYSPTMAALLIALVVLLMVALLCVVALYFMRWRKRSMRAGSLDFDDEEKSSSARHHRVTVRPHESIIVYQEKQSLINNSEAPPSSNSVPEIRIHFPEEVDTSGKRQSGRVVVVRVGEHSIGLEPVSENLPPYQKSESDRFQSLDLERIGGLKEKNVEARYQ
jgi:flagellar basal body-associated protein FliL